MALLDSEVARCKAELGFSLLGNNQVYIGTTILFEQVIQPYLGAGAKTTSSTAVAASDEPTPRTLVLADATGFHAGDRVVLDVDGRRESSTVQVLSGSSVTLLLSGVHAGTYPVTVEGGEAIVRELLDQIRACKAEMSKTFGEGALKAVDEVQFYETGGTLFSSIGRQLMFWRDELAAVLGITSMWARRRSGAQRMSVY